MKKIFTLILVIAFGSGAFAQDAYEIAKKMDNVKKPLDSKVNSTMILTNKKGKTQSKTIRSIGKDNNSKQIIWFLAPARDKGVSFLKIEKPGADDVMHLWLPSFKKIRRIKSSQKGDSFMGSDMSYEDMTNRELDEYTYALLGEETLDGVGYYLLESKPKPEVGSSYSKIISWVDKESYIPVKEEFYNLKGKKYKLKIVKYKMLKGYHFPFEIYVEDLIKKHNTILTMSDIELDTQVKDDIFQEKYLKRKPL